MKNTPERKVLEEALENWRRGELRTQHTELWELFSNFIDNYFFDSIKYEEAKQQIESQKERTRPK